ncbi:MAG TPA: glycogen debranching protein, partial [Ohtaekwangia sp.]|nr:glycogen debranching protein [Ohtaekwangia sp.]
AWEIYKVTGDQQWLRTIYPIVKKSMAADLKNVLDKETGLVRGESSFLDWREQTYPGWMEPADIFQSVCLGTNAVHHEANKVLASMAKALGETDVANRHARIADGIKKAVNDHLWLDDRQYYAQYLYGRNFRIPSPRSEALGEALCILFDIADPQRQKHLVANTPVNDFGIPCIYPQIPDTPPYHNDAIWPFVQSYWTMASAKAGNEKAVLHSLAAIWRPAALFLTNKENFVAGTGDYAATQINSDNMLWSLSGSIAMIYKVLFGMDYRADAITFRPFVPQALKGKHTLTNYHYRDAILAVDMEGFGNEIKSITLNGKPLPNATVPSTLKGRHYVKIVLADKPLGGEVNMAPHHVTPTSPALSHGDSALVWSRSKHGVRYKVMLNGKLLKEAVDTTLRMPGNQFAEYQVIAVDRNGHESFASAPMLSTPAGILIVEAESCNTTIENRYHGFSGDGYVRTSPAENPVIKFQFTAEHDGSYAIDFRYANGNGPVNTDNKCAMRTMKVDGQSHGTVVLPQRGREEWSDWGFSSGVMISLTKGDHEISLEYEPHNANMSVSVNEAVVDYVRIIRTK